VDPRTLAVGFVGVLLGGTMTFVIVTNDERMASSHDHVPGDVHAVAAAAHSDSHESGHTESHSAEADHADDHTLVGEAAHTDAGTHADGHTDSTVHTESADGVHTGEGHGPGDTHPPGADPHGPGDTHSPNPGDPGHPHPAPPAGQPPGNGVTPDQQAAADKLLADTKAALPQWSDESKVAAAGFRTLGDFGTGYDHLVNWNWIDDGTVLDPNHPESLVYRVTPQGRVLEAAMYVLPFGTAPQDIPDVGGALTQWHVHNNLCFTPERITDGYPQRLVNGLTDAAGNCPRGQKLPPAPMLHVWIVEHPCGPFASLEGVGGGQAVDEPQDPNADPACQHSH
jgi:hypothetical protein